MIDSFIGFFNADVLNLYKSHPDKYELDVDFSGGVLKTTDAYFTDADSDELNLAGRQDEYIHIRFGYHSLQDGTLCLAVFLPDLVKAPEIEKKKWGPFIVEKSLLSQSDKRFEMWYERYILGSWNVESGPRKRLARIIEKINACCKTLVGAPLYTEVPNSSVCYPVSQNSHAYEDAHSDLYGFVIDSLSKKCLLDFAKLREKTIPEAERMRLPVLLRHVFSELDENSKLHIFLAKVSKQRGKSNHNVRPPAVKSDAFGDFYGDLEVATEAYKELLQLIESEFGISSEHELKRHVRMRYLPKISDEVVEPHYSICKAAKMEGKTVEKVWFGMREDIAEVHQSEVLFLQFTDGEILAMETGSNARDLVDRIVRDPNEFHVDFMLTWVPAPFTAT